MLCHPLAFPATNAIPALTVIIAGTDNAQLATPRLATPISRVIGKRGTRVQ
jgi:hypothetical protein